MSKIFVVEAKSESGDDYGPYLFSVEPTRKQLLQMFLEESPDEVDMAHPELEFAPDDSDEDYGPGNYGYLHVEIHEREIEDFGKSTEYFQKIEDLAKELISAAIQEDSFEVFLGDGAVTPLQKAIVKLAQEVKYMHTHDDGCLE